MTLREKIERANPTVDSPTYRRLTGQMTEKDYKRTISEEQRRLQQQPKRDQAASEH